MNSDIKSNNNHKPKNRCPVCNLILVNTYIFKTDPNSTKKQWIKVGEYCKDCKTLIEVW